MLVLSAGSRTVLVLVIEGFVRGIAMACGTTRKPPFPKFVPPPVQPLTRFQATRRPRRDATIAGSIEHEHEHRFTEHEHDEQPEPYDRPNGSIGRP